MCYTRRKTEGGEGALWESDDANFLNPNGQSRNLNIYGYLPSYCKHTTPQLAVQTITTTRIKSLASRPGNPGSRMEDNCSPSTLLRQYAGYCRFYWAPSKLIVHLCVTRLQPPFISCNSLFWFVFITERRDWVGGRNARCKCENHYG